MKTKKHIIFMWIFIILIILYVGLITLDETTKDADLYNRCHMVCEIYHNMTFEGVKDGQCACNPSIMTRIYIKP